MEAVADDVWGVQDAITMPGGVVFPLRMTVVRLPDRALWLHSPVRLDDAVAAELDALGPVGWIIAPSALHHLHAGAAAARWPQARVWVAEGVAAKQPTLRIDGTLPGDPPWADVLRPVLLRGAPSLNEVVFVHRPTATLICTDLLFNITPANLLTRAVLATVGCDGRLAASRSWRFVFTKDTEALRASVDELLQERITRVVPAHGAVADVTPEGLRAALGWVAPRG